MTPERDVEHLDIDVGSGLRLHVARSGSGPALVLLHGFTGSSGNWARIRPMLDGAFTVLAVDMPGHGRSSAPADPARYALPRFADDLAALLDALAIERVALLGYSMGGRAALHCAVRHPRRISALVLESASPGIRDASEREARKRSDAELASALEREGVPAFVDRWERLPLWASQAALPEEARSALRAQRLANSASALANSLRGAGAAAHSLDKAQLAAAMMPTLLLAGALDPKYVALGRQLASELPNARVEIIPNAGHAIHLEQPHLFVRAVAPFVAERRGP